MQTVLAGRKTVIIFNSYNTHPFALCVRARGFVQQVGNWHMHIGTVLRQYTAREQASLWVCPTCASIHGSGDIDGERLPQLPCAKCMKSWKKSVNNMWGK